MTLIRHSFNDDVVLMRTSFLWGRCTDADSTLFQTLDYWRIPVSTFSRNTCILSKTNKQSTLMRFYIRLFLCTAPQWTVHCHSNIAHAQRIFSCILAIHCPLNTAVYCCTVYCLLCLVYWLIFHKYCLLCLAYCSLFTYFKFCSCASRIQNQCRSRQYTRK